MLELRLREAAGGAVTTPRDSAGLTLCDQEKIQFSNAIKLLGYCWRSGFPN